VAADPDYRELLPYVDLAANPPRARPRTIADFSAGYARHTDAGRRWEIALQVSNLANRTALYNFQSLFVGTRIVQPRTAGIRLRWYWR
jgi:outer membrane receptor protein involved in Fe transport